MNDYYVSKKKKGQDNSIWDSLKDRIFTDMLRVKYRGLNATIFVFKRLYM